jgi:DTW domain-containing protein YfiP
MNVKRATCATCLRAASACICRWVQPVDGTTPVLILQHPLEVANAKNSARLLHLSLPGSTLAVGETFTEEQLAALLAGPRQPVLLYPDTPDAPAAPFEPAPGTDVLLVVLDATWRKSRKMLHLNPALRALPRLALRDVPASHYVIRKAHRPGQLSTLEATAYALAQLEHDDVRYMPLIDAFDGFVAQVQATEALHRAPSVDRFS